jgi:ubiquinone/menaquinone biosynthesis C-methylase UbiE
MPYPDGEFDTVLFIEAIEHLNNMKEVDRALSEIGRVARDGGTVVIATPNYGSLTGRLQDRLYGIFQKGAYAEEHRVKFTHETLKDICGKHGFVFEESIIPMGSDMVCKFRKGAKVEVSS